MATLEVQQPEKRFYVHTHKAGTSLIAQAIIGVLGATMLDVEV